MEKEYRYQLMEGGKKEICPQCGGGPNCEKTFKRYIDKHTGEILPLPSGRCDRINNCNYHSNPYKNGEAEKLYHEEKGIYGTKKIHHSTMVSSFPPYRERKLETPQYDTIPSDIYLGSGTPAKYNTNIFICYLREYFGADRTNTLIREYCIGNSLNNNGATVFWQVSYTGEVRTGKEITYNIVPNPEMHLGKNIKRSKATFPFLIHKSIKPEFKVYPCFFGEHLLKRYPEKSVIIVESEKSAIIASVFYPDFVCIAAGGSAGCKWGTEQYAMKHLIGRSVVMYPDLKNTEAWEKKATFLRDNGVNVMVSRKLVSIASKEDFGNDNDLADYLLRYKPPGLNPKTTIGQKEPEIQKQDQQLKQILREAELQFTNDTNQEWKAYVDQEGKLYIPTPLSDTYTIRQSIEHYNNRNGTIEFIKKHEIDVTSFREVFIDNATLKIILN